MQLAGRQRREQKIQIRGQTRAEHLDLTAFRSAIHRSLLTNREKRERPTVCRYLNCRLNLTSVVGSVSYKVDTFWIIV